jgi:tetratricopeptide (TPR) repeat protein
MTSCSHERSAGPRRVRVPPALVHGSEALPAAPVLEEVDGDLGVTLWRSVRNVLLWASARPEARGGLFAPGAAAERETAVAAAGVDPELLAPLSVFIRLLEAPAAMDLARVVNACRRVSLWAEHRGALGTALEFAQAAALVAPHLAHLAYAVGRLARRRAEYDRAESWYGRAILQARRAGDWAIYARGFSGLGNLYVQRGNFPAARRAHGRCLAAARRHRLHELRGDALHDLFVLAFETGSGGDPLELARGALAAYGSSSPKLLRLAYDVAYFWTLQGCFAEACRVAVAVLPFMEGAEERLVVLGDIGRAAGGLGDRTRYRDAAVQAEAIVRSGEAPDAVARALLGLAHGAASLGEWEEAERLLTGAAERARRRGESKILMTAEAMLGSVRSRHRTQGAIAAGVHLGAAAPFAEEIVGALAGLAR